MLDGSGLVLRRASGAIFLSGAGTPSGPLRRRAELAELVQEVERGQHAVVAAESALQATSARLVEREKLLTEAAAASERAREEERQATAVRDDAVRLAANLAREWKDSEAQLGRITERLTAAERRLAEVDAGAGPGRHRPRPNRRGARHHSRARSPSSRPSRSRLGSSGCTGRCRRPRWREAFAPPKSGSSAPRRTRAEAETAAETLGRELEQLETDTAAIATQQAEWREARAERRSAVQELEAATADAETPAGRRPRPRSSRPSAAWRTTRAALEAANEESHSLQVRLTESAGARRSIVERVEAEWRKPFEQLMETAPMLDLDLETLQAEAGTCRRHARVHRSGESPGGRGACRRSETARVPHHPARRPGRARGSR